MRIRSVSATNVGLVRERNEDSLLVMDDLRVYAVADGMGGHAGGAEASAISVGVLKGGFTANISLQGLRPKSISESFDILFRYAHQKIVEKSLLFEHLSGMGTTLTGCTVAQDILHVAHVGDSAAFLVRNREAQKITTDHVHPFMKNALLNCLGGGPEHFSGADHHAVALQPGDAVVLATDGLTRYADAAFIAHVAASTPFDKLADRLVQHALAAGGRDNVTVVALLVKA